jgi:hypothetical protein
MIDMRYNMVSLRIGLGSNTAFLTIEDPHTMMRILKIADQMIVPAPTLSPPITNNAIAAVKNSGALLQTAIRVAPATSSESLSFLLIISRDPTKYLSQTTARR